MCFLLLIRKSNMLCACPFKAYVEGNMSGSWLLWNHTPQLTSTLSYINRLKFQRERPTYTCRCPCIRKISRSCRKWKLPSAIDSVSSSSTLCNSNVQTTVQHNPCFFASRTQSSSTNGWCVLSLTFQNRTGKMPISRMQEPLTYFSAAVQTQI